MIKRMKDDEFELRATAFTGPLIDDHARARKAEKHLKDQMILLFDYLVEKHPLEIFNDNPRGACKTAVEIMENQSKAIKLHGRLCELFKEESDLLKLDRNKLIELVGKLKSICLQ